MIVLAGRIVSTTGAGGVVNVWSAPATLPSPLVARTRTWRVVPGERPCAAALTGTAVVPAGRFTGAVVLPYAVVGPKSKTTAVSLPRGSTVALKDADVGLSALAAPVDARGGALRNRCTSLLPLSVNQMYPSGPLTTC